MLVNVTDSRNVGISGVALSGSGPGTFSGSTNSTGCVLWRNVPVGTYTMSVGGTAAGMVDQNGNAPANQPVSVVDQGTNTVNLQYDRPGSIQGISFRTRDYANALVASSADSVIVSNTGMQVAEAVHAGRRRTGGIDLDDVDSLPLHLSLRRLRRDVRVEHAAGRADAGQLHGPRGRRRHAVRARLHPASLSAGHRLERHQHRARHPVSAAKVTAKDTGCNITRTLTTIDEHQRPGRNRQATSDSRMAPMTSAPRTPRQPTRGPSPGVGLTSAGCAPERPSTSSWAGQPAGTCP